MNAIKQEQLKEELFLAVAERYPGLNEAQQQAIARALLAEITTEFEHSAATIVKGVLKRNHLCKP